VAVTLAALAGCSETPSPDDSNAPDATDVQQDAASASPTLAAGEVRLRIDAGAITLRANAAPRRPLLERLSHALSFELAATDVGDEPITLAAEAATLRDLLPLLLPDRAYRVDYRFDAVSTRHEVARLEIGAAGASQVRQPASARRAAALAGSAEPDPAPPAARSLQRREPRQAWRALMQQLDDSDAEDRVEAIQKIKPERDGLGVLIERLAADPSPRVRAAAARQLEDSDTLVAVDALIRALSDPDKRVVLDAIEALEFTDDESVADDLAPLTQHPDREIAEAAIEAQCFIRWDCD
jgi:hypothetical protein